VKEVGAVAVVTVRAIDPSTRVIDINLMHILYIFPLSSYKSLHACIHHPLYPRCLYDPVGPLYMYVP
jgi:hypothetical protein